MPRDDVSRGRLLPSHPSRAYLQDARKNIYIVHSLAYKTQTSNARVKNKQRVNGKDNPILDDTAATKYTDTRREGPADENNVDRNARYPDQANGGEKGGNDEREQRVADYTHTLRKGTVTKVSEQGSDDAGGSSGAHTYFHRAALSVASRLLHRSKRGQKRR